jgi:hypothetical protein
MCPRSSSRVKPVCIPTSVAQAATRRTTVVRNLDDVFDGVNGVWIRRRLGGQDYAALAVADANICAGKTHGDLVFARTTRSLEFDLTNLTTVGVVGNTFQFVSPLANHLAERPLLRSRVLRNLRLRNLRLCHGQ